MKIFFRVLAIIYLLGMVPYWLVVRGGWGDKHIIFTDPYQLLAGSFVFFTLLILYLSFSGGKNKSRKLKPAESIWLLRKGNVYTIRQ